MKARMLQLSGGLILLACLMFAVPRMESADRWIARWIPLVVVGVALALASAITEKKRRSDPAIVLAQPRGRHGLRQAEA